MPVSISLLMYLCTSLHAPVSDGAKVKFSHFIALGMGSLRIAKVTYLYEEIISIERHVIVYLCSYLRIHLWVWKIKNTLSSTEHWESKLFGDGFSDPLMTS